MAEQGLNKIISLQRRYLTCQFTADVLFSAALAMLISCFLYAAFAVPGWWSIPLFVIIFGCIAVIKKWWRVDIKTITTFLNLKYPDLEESSELALKETSELNLLEKMQLARIEEILEVVPLSQKQFAQRFKFSLLFFIIVCVFGFIVIRVQGAWHNVNPHLFVPAGVIATNTPPEKTLPQIESVSLTITPPVYTGKPQREQDKFTLEVEDGSVVVWKLKLNVAVKQVSLLFNSRDRIALKNNGNADYEVQKLIDKPGFYQVDIDGKLSDLYSIQVIKDNPPVIHIKTPQQYTYIDAGEVRRVTIGVAVDDDYGISNAFIQATIAKGSGEAVKFKEQKIAFETAFKGKQHYDLQKLISLPALNMEPGDELYFYIQAQDNHNQQSRSDVYIVAIQDTAQLLSMDGLLQGVNIKPEYFRSERQIILDSERLLRDKDSISNETFKSRSNDLGTDQKLLRLRYGKFLGEESESAIDPSQKGDDPVGDVKNYGNAAVVLDAYTDKHDNAEDAQFFDPSVKAQLKATLNEMWKAELQLRLNNPQGALPFEYKALRLLKDLQQKSRVYVAKTSYNPAPLKMEKRLTGELDKIIQPVNHQDIKMASDEFSALKDAVSILEQLNNGTKLSGADMHTLQLANLQLSEKASAQPEIYLGAVSAMHRVLSAQKIKSTDIGTIEKAIQRLLPSNKPLPGNQPNSADMGLSKEYYKNLNHK
ncbi:MAG TPA: DUF4175 family protein [Mucilaginibacter sp.]|nr:DUF4175 family protein [Mucilaginibacter sp.]